MPETFRPFIDIAGNTHEPAIVCAASAEIARGAPQGLSADRYGPFLTTRRDQMASLIVRLIDTANGLEAGENNIADLPAYDGTAAFTDVAVTSPHVEAVNRLAQVDVVRGGPQGRPLTHYRPELPVSRGQMASFINRAVEFMTGTPFTTGNDYFTDDNGATHEGNTNGIASRGIAVGDGVDTFGLLEDVKRDQITSFLIRTLAVLEQDGEIVPLGEGGDRPEDFTVEPDEVQTLDAVANPDDSDGDNRSYTTAGLVGGQEYRVTLVRDELISGEDNDAPVFTDSDGDNLAETGMPTADIVGVDGASPQNNTGDRAAPTGNDPASSGSAAFTAPEDGSVTITIDGDQDGEDVRPVVYRNGGGSNQPDDGGADPRLELNDDSTTAEPVDVGGVTRFVDRDGAGEATVGVEDGPVQAGDEFLATVRGDRAIASVRVVFGPCVDEQTFTQDEDPEAAGFQVSVQTRRDAAGGDCDVDFETTFDDGTINISGNRATVEIVARDGTVEVKNTSVQAGREARATVRGDDAAIESVRVSGPCLDEQTFTQDEDPQVEGFQVSVQTPADEGNTCTLTFETTFDDGTTVTDTAEIEIAANQARVDDVDDGPVQAGDEAMATVRTGDAEIESVRVTGPCVDEQTFPGPAAEDFEVLVQIREDAEGGDCVLTFETTFANDAKTTDTDRVTIEIVANQGEASVDAEDGPVMAGDEVMTTVTAEAPRAVESVQVTGPCVDEQTFRGDEDPGDEGFQVSVKIREDAEGGDCTLTFETSFDNGTTTTTDTVTVEVRP